MSARCLRLWVAFLALAAAVSVGVPVQAHTGGVTGYVRVLVADNALRYELTLSTLPEAWVAAQGGDLARALPAAAAVLAERLAIATDGQPCVAAAHGVTPPTDARSSVTIALDFVCPTPIASLTLRDDSFDVFGADLHILGRAAREETVREFNLATEAREVRLEFGGASGTEAPSQTSGFAAYLTLGIEHILLGYDHLLFLLVLLIAGGGLRQIVGIVTAFTLAHSITLALTVTDVLSLPPALVEAAIAASIVWVAAENLWTRHPLSRRIWVTALFGLVHGSGFAAVLREIGMPRDGLWVPLLGFNLGVELGQVAVILLVVPALRLVVRAGRAPWLPQGISLVVGGVGLWLLLERLFLA